MEPIVEVGAVPAGAVFADVRWYLDGRPGSEAFRAGHVPGAVYVEMDGCLAAPASPADGRHPLPSPEAFAACMSAAGIGDGTPVVAYDDVRGSVAARLVWMLRALGEDAALLDGGLPAWPGPLEMGGGTASAPASFTPRPWPAERLASIDEVAAGGLVVVDSRAPDRYRGEVEPIDPRAGHIPGAVNRPSSGNLDPETGRFLAADQLRDRFEDGAVVYCGSGVNACHNLLAMERAGLRGRLFPGSWSQWSSDPDRPVATVQ